MIVQFRNLLPLSFVTLFIAGCGQTYSPFLMLPKEPMSEHDLQIVGAVGGMPLVSENFPGVTLAEEGMIRYGISDHLTLQAEEWTDGVNPFGTSIGSIVLLSKRASPWRFALVPRLAMMNNSNEITGWGGSMTLAAWTPDLFGLHPYLGAGALIGSGHLDYQVTPVDNGDQYTSDRTYPIGFGGALNAGLEYDLFQHISFNAEVASSGIIIRESPGNYDWNTFLVWGLSAGYHF